MKTFTSTTCRGGAEERGGGVKTKSTIPPSKIKDFFHLPLRKGGFFVFLLTLFIDNEYFVLYNCIQ